MFPDKPGGFPLYAHEGWRQHFSLVGPVATFGYWLGWSVVLSFLGIFIGQIIQGAWFPGEPAGTPIDPDNNYFQILDVGVGLPHLIAAGLILAVWLFNIFGVARRRPVRVPRRCAADDPALLLHVPAVHQRRLVERQHDMGCPRRHRGHGGGRRLALHLGGHPPLDRLAVDHVVVVVGRRHVRHVRARVQGHGQRHAPCPALRLHLHVRRLHHAAARPRGRGRRGDGRRVRLRRRARAADGLGEPDELLRRRHLHELPDLDEHRHRRRRARPLRDRTRPHDGQAALPPEQAPRAGPGDDASTWCSTSASCS